MDALQPDQDPRAMAFRIQLIALVISIAFVLLVLELVRRRRLDERYSLAWLLGGALVLAFSVFRDLQIVLADIVGVFYAPALVFGALIFFLLLLTLHLSTVTTRLEMHNRHLAQRVALLEHRLSRTQQNDAAPNYRVTSEANVS